MSMKTVLAAAGLLLSIACGGGGSANGSATFTGTVRGQSLSPKEVLSANATIPTSAGSASVGAIIMTSQTNTCSNAAASKEAKNSQYFVIALGELKIDGGNVTIIAPTGPGDFVVYAGGSTTPAAKLAIIVSERTGGDCKDDAGQEAVGTAGTVRVTSISNGAYSGTFDITLTKGDGSGNAVSGGSTDHVTGSFTAASCASLGALVSTTRATTCI